MADRYFLMMVVLSSPLFRASPKGDVVVNLTLLTSSILWPKS
ncbi:hypothetical protein [Bilophila wadsworthia]|nr:hypothetical protein [Bilophila wadsworthia]